MHTLRVAYKVKVVDSPSANHKKSSFRPFTNKNKNFVSLVQLDVFYLFFTTNHKTLGENLCRFTSYKFP